MPQEAADSEESDHGTFGRMFRPELPKLINEVYVQIDIVDKLSNYLFNPQKKNSKPFVYLISGDWYHQLIYLKDI